MAICSTDCRDALKETPRELALEAHQAFLDEEHCKAKITSTQFHLSGRLCRFSDQSPLCMFAATCTLPAAEIAYPLSRPVFRRNQQRRALDIAVKVIGWRRENRAALRLPASETTFAMPRALQLGPVPWTARTRQGSREWHRLNEAIQWPAICARRQAIPEYWRSMPCLTNTIRHQAHDQSQPFGSSGRSKSLTRGRIESTSIRPEELLAENLSSADALRIASKSPAHQKQNCRALQ